MTDTFPQKTLVFMIDGFDMEYYYGTNMPVMKQMAKEGFFKAASAIFPSLTNANNISIACGCWPEQHGVTTNCYYDTNEDKAVFLEHPDILQAPTIFNRAKQEGIGSALLTCKAKTTKILGQGATFALAAEAPGDEVIARYGTPPPMYSTEINYWLFDVALDLVQTRPDLGLIYVHTTDYPMHMWPPESQESQEHMKTLDKYLAKFKETASDFTIALTADHGMNRKTRCWDLAKACSNRGISIKFAVSPVADRLLKHHRGFGGVSYVYLNAPQDFSEVAQTIAGLEGVEMVLDKAAAAKKFSLMESRIGDLVVIPDKDTVFGDLPKESEELAEDYRSHGSLYELQVPLLLYNYQGDTPRYRDLNYNLDLTDFLFNRVSG